MQVICHVVNDIIYNPNLNIPDQYQDFMEFNNSICVIQVICHVVNDIIYNYPNLNIPDAGITKLTKYRIFQASRDTFLNTMTVNLSS